MASLARKFLLTKQGLLPISPRTNSQPFTGVGLKLLLLSVSMTDIDTLISVVKAQVATENEARYGGHNTLKVYSSCEQPYAPAIYFDLKNDFCILNNVLPQPNSLAAYLFVKLDDAEQILSCRLKRSDQVRDFEEWEDLPSLEVSIPDEEIASKLIDYVVTATKLQ